MEYDRRMILIKLGGSIITNKGKSQSARRKTIDNILKQIKRIDEPKILVLSLIHI